VTRIVLCNQLDRLHKILETTPGPMSYLRLQRPQEDQHTTGYLLGLPDANELPVSQLARERSEDFRIKYIEFLGQLNKDNHSHQWWVMPFTNKYALTSRLCRNLFNFQLIIDAIRSGTQTLVVLTSSQELACQVERYGSSQGISVINSIQNRFEPKIFMRRFLPIGIVKAVFQTFALWILGRKFRPKLDHSTNHFLVATHTHSRSFPADKTYHDAYFGPLLNELTESGQNAVILGLPYEQPFQLLRKIRHLNGSIPVVPVDSCLTLATLLTCSFKAMAAFWRAPQPKQPVLFDGLDVSYLANRAIYETTHSGDIFVNLRMYYSSKWLANRIKISRCLYPYENRSWEKMLILGVAESSQETKTVGYQHTSITPHHANFFFSEEEEAITPLPNTIVTCGDMTRDWLTKEGNYPSDTISSGCALRQLLPSRPCINEHTESTSRGPIKNLLVALATGDEEYDQAPPFLQEALGLSSHFQVRMRPHPNLALALSAKPFFTISNAPLEDDLDWADVVLYASSTVSMEAIALGIPAIYLDLGNFLNTDPMFGWNEFKWPVTEPFELIKTIEQIDAIPQEKFKNLQQKGLDYVYSYLKPVTPSNMQPFWKA